MTTFTAINSTSEFSRPSKRGVEKSVWRKCPVAMFVVIGFFVGLGKVAPSHAQEARRQFVEGLLKSLIETQLDRRPAPPNRPAPSAPSPELNAIRLHLEAFSQQLNELVYAMNANLARAPDTRSLLVDVIKLNASATHVKTRAATAQRLDDVQPDFLALDRDWRLLAYRLNRATGLNPDCRRIMAGLNALNATLGGSLGVAPQVDLRAVATTSQAISTSLHHLMQDIEVAVSRTRGGRALVAEAGQVQQRATRLNSLVASRGSYDDLVQHFLALHGGWKSLAIKVRQLDDRSLERNVRRIDESMLLLHELLWLPQDVDYGRLSHLTRTLTSDVDRLFDVVSLNVLLELPTSARVLPIAGEFYGLCENFADSVAAQAPLAELQSNYRYLVDSWPELARSFRGSRKPEVLQALTEIEESFVTLRDAVGLHSQVDWRRGAELGASVLSQADSLSADIQRYVFANPRYDQQFRFNAARDATTFRTAARRLNEALVNRQPEVVAERAGSLAMAWDEFNGRVYSKLTAPDQQQLRETRIGITQSVIELQALLQL